MTISKKALSGVVIFILLIILWVVLAAGVLLLTDRAPAALVVLPNGKFFAQMPDDAAIISRSPFSITLSGSDPAFTRRLYKAGAWLVVPAGLEGCLSSQKLLPKKG